MPQEESLLKIEYVKAPHYTTGSAAMVVVAGPTGDGMVHLHFVREVLALRSESMRKVNLESASGSGPAPFRLEPTGQLTTPELYREVVATITMPAATLRGIAQTLVSVAEIAERIAKQAVSGASDAQGAQGAQGA